MQVIPLQAIPAQTLNVTLDGNDWVIGIKLTNETISFTFELNGVMVIENTRAVGGARIIPSKYQEAGNFALITQNFEIPDYTKFGNTQQLVYITAAELEALRVRNTGLITEADFNPVGALPLRFKPQGYTLA